MRNGLRRELRLCRRVRGVLTVEVLSIDERGLGIVCGGGLVKGEGRRLQVLYRY